MDPEIDLKCKICGKVLKNTRSFASHFRESHKDLNYKDYLRFTHFGVAVGFCKVCGTPVQKISLSYIPLFCCHKCMGVYYHTNEQAKAERYEKTKQTYLKKYGIENIFKDIKFIKQKTKEKFGVENAMQSLEIQEKAKQTRIKKYGVDHPSKSEIVKLKIYNTHKQNHTFNTSKPELKLLEILQNKFGDFDIEYQYKSPQYPFVCDFYIKSLDLYIELQGSWTHGKAPYDPKNEKHIKKLLEWKQKSQTSQFYRNAIDVWTRTDVEKRRIAKENGIKLIEVFDSETFKELDFILKKI